MSDFFSSSERWPPYYDQDDQTSVTATAAAAVTATSSVSKHDVTPYYDQEEQTTAAATTAVPNPAAGRRRRTPSTSRRSNTPTTLLNANPSNFRALVQQFTGCSSANSNSGKRKGPITLNFAAPTDNNGNGYGTGGGYNSGYGQAMQTASYQQGYLRETASYQAADQQSGYVGDVDDGMGMSMLEEFVMDDLDSLISR